MNDRLEPWRQYKEAVLGTISDYALLFEGLERQAPSGDGWITALCPFHSDTNPSFAFNRNTGRWMCFAGCGKGGPLDYVMQTTGMNFKDTLLGLGDRLGVPRPFTGSTDRPPIDESKVKDWVTCLWANAELLQWLREKRGLSDDTIRKYEIGWDPKRSRCTIPIRDEGGHVVNIRLYNAEKDPKMMNYTEGPHKYGSPPRLYGIDEFVKHEGQQVIVCEGEWDRLLLRQEGLMAVTGTHGASVFRPDWLPYFKGKHVVVLYDCDPEGRAAVQKTVLPALQGAGVASVKDVVLPLKGDKDDKDVTDYLHKRGFSAEELQKLIDRTCPHRYGETEKPEDIVELSSFTEIERKDLIDKKVRCEITICGETSEAFHAVESFRVTHCSRMQKGGCYECRGAVAPEVIPRGSQEYIGSCMSANVQVVSMLRHYACRHGNKPTIEILSKTTVKEFFCHQRVNRITQTHDKEGNVTQMADGKPQELLEKRVYYLSGDHPRPGDYVATGWVKTHPKTQQVTFLIEHLEPLEDDFESFDVEANSHHLRAFQALSYEEILHDLETHVTGIYERDAILTVILLTYCSPRWIRFNKDIVRGWLVSVILGDSGTGKTQTHQRIAEFVNIGDCLSGLTSSRTGLAYALVEHPQKGWNVRVGRYPANSRKILTVDEAQFIPDWQMRTISKAMEEGFLQIDRVQSKGYESQTRLIMLANPKQDAVMDTFTFGCEALGTIFPPTIIRRVDVAVFANAADVKDLSCLNRKRSDRTGRRVTPEMLRSVIYWAWNLQPDQIIFTSEAESYCLSVAAELPKKYGYAVDIPLVTAADCRNKLARLSAAFAVLDLSADDHFSRLIVEPKHVHWACDFLDDLYSHENCALDDYSDVVRSGSELVDYDVIAATCLERGENEKHALRDEDGAFAKIVWILRATKSIRRDDLAEQVGCSVETVGRVVKILKRFNLVDSTRDGYVKKPKFNKFLRRFAKEHREFFESETSLSGFKTMGYNEIDRVFEGT